MASPQLPTRQAHDVYYPDTMESESDDRQNCLVRLLVSRVVFVILWPGLILMSLVMAVGSVDMLTPACQDVGHCSETACRNDKLMCPVSCGRCGLAGLPAHPPSPPPSPPSPPQTPILTGKWTCRAKVMEGGFILPLQPWDVYIADWGNSTLHGWTLDSWREELDGDSHAATTYFVKFPTTRELKQHSVPAFITANCTLSGSKFLACSTNVFKLRELTLTRLDTNTRTGFITRSVVCLAALLAYTLLVCKYMPDRFRLISNALRWCAACKCCIPLANMCAIMNREPDPETARRMQEANEAHLRQAERNRIFMNQRGLPS
eukprot:TRINITY_DN72185_c0_g1_i1.p1 TRINITY_DN72185_c0_g1~~TRINITY_DN72185_c0_g1_i1.p1  ORF type:complete len:319 (-),score=23.43 TRINITY_DN72185_c0_g1_i1:144-1100(-)